MRLRLLFSSWVAATMFALTSTTIGGIAAGAISTEQSDDPGFDATVEPIHDALGEEMSGVSWHPGCPVPIADLRLITMNYWGFDGEVQRGELVVHKDVAIDVVGVFSQLYNARFPIRLMERIDVHEGDDDVSMAADNTSAFNCREITGGRAFSIHSWGKAVDINPVENPYVKDGIVLPPAGAAFLDRDDIRPGMIHDGDVVTTAFAAAGFTWGGNWDRLKDYQHFEIEDPAAGTPDGTAGSSEIPDTAEFPACSSRVPSSDAWTGEAGALVDPGTGNVDTAAFNEFLSTVGPPVSTSPCDAARVFLHLDRPREDGETLVVVVEPVDLGVATVTITFDHLADDSVAAVRYELRFEEGGDGTIRLASGMWSQRCQPNRGHQDFSAALCV